MTVYGYILLAVGLIQYCHAHAGHGPPPPRKGPPPNSFHDPNMVHNEEHIKEHMQNEVNTNKPMTPEEMEFNYFRLHDTSSDSKLDGLEILAALTHMLPPPELQPEETAGKTPEEIEKMKSARHSEMFDNHIQVIDKVLAEDDKNQDGYLSYAEYQLARRRDEQRMREAQQNMTPEQLQQQQMMMQQHQQQMMQQHQQMQQQQMMQQHQHQQQQQQMGANQQQQQQQQMGANQQQSVVTMNQQPPLVNQQVVQPAV